MKKPLVYVTILGLSLAPNLYAGDEEYMEVTAPNECCQSPMPAGLGLIMSMGGPVAAAAASGGLKGAALKVAATRAAEQRAQQEQQSQEQKQTQYNDAIQNRDAGKQSNVWDFLINLTNNLFGSGHRIDSKYTTKNDDGTITESTIRDCKAGGPLNPNNVPCTQHKFELFTDPTDGMERWAYTMAVVEPKYNPKHYDADSSGYYPAVIGNQTFTIVFETQADLLWQLQRIGGRH